LLELTVFIYECIKYLEKQKIQRPLRDKLIELMDWHYELYKDEKLHETISQLDSYHKLFDENSILQETRWPFGAFFNKATVDKFEIIKQLVKLSGWNSIISYRKNHQLRRFEEQIFYCEARINKRAQPISPGISNRIRMSQ